MFLDDAYGDLYEVVENEQWEALLPYLFEKMACPANLQAQVTDLFQANLHLLLNLRHSTKTIVVSPVLAYIHGIADYVIDDVIVELKTSESVAASQVCQVALYTFAARRGGIYIQGIRGARTLPDATPALHYARFGVIAKVPMPSVSEAEAYPILFTQPVSELVQDYEWLGRTFDMGEVQALCADLEAYLTSRGLQVPAGQMSPTESSVLGSFVDVLVKMALIRDFPQAYLSIRDELVRVAIQFRRLWNERGFSN